MRLLEDDDAKSAKQLIHEVVGSESYDYYPLGDYVVSAPGICGGRPTFKYTRIEVEVVLDLLAARQLERLVENFQGACSQGGYSGGPEAYGISPETRSPRNCMIILDENMLGLRLDIPIARWYAGRVCYLTDLRPGTVIKDEAIPQLLR